MVTLDHLTALLMVSAVRRPVSAEKRSRRGDRVTHLLQGLALIAASILVALFISEASLRLAGISYPSFYTADRYCGSALRPGASGWWRKEGLSYVHINSDGLRDREHSIRKPANTVRIAVLGDSFAEAFQVPMQNAFWAEMERRLAACKPLSGKKVEAISFGVCGYGTAQELEMLRHRAWKYSPDMVLLAVTTANDIRNNSRQLEQDEMRPYFVVRDGRLILDDSFLSSTKYRLHLSYSWRILEKLIPYSRVIQSLNEAKNVWAAKRWAARMRFARPRSSPQGYDGPELGLDEAVFKRPTDPAWRDAWDVTDRLLLAMHHEVVAGGAKFLVVTLTTGEQTNPDPRIRTQFMKSLGVSDLFYPDLRIKALGEQDHFEVLNLGQPFQTYAEQHRVYLHGFPNLGLGTGHWNLEGHRLAGEMIADKLCRMFEPPRELSKPPWADHSATTVR
jgi:hypothetical protein